MDQHRPLLKYPWDPGFWEIYHSCPPPGKRVSPFFVVDPHTLELKNVDELGMEDYILGGALEHVENHWASV